MADLAKLIARVEALTGPDRETDGLIFGWLHETEPCGTFMCGFDEEKFQFRHPLDSPLGRYRAWYVRGSDLPSYTASLDAAVALTERVLPGWACRIEKWQSDCFAKLWECDPEGKHKSGMAQHVASSPTPAIALILATLKALAAKEVEG